MRPLQKPTNDLYKKSLDAAWELVEICKLDRTLNMQTAFNPFKLLRNIESAEQLEPFICTVSLRPACPL